MTLRAIAIADRNQLDRLFNLLAGGAVAVKTIYTNILSPVLYRAPGLEIACSPACDLYGLSPDDADLCIVLRNYRGDGIDEILLDRGFERKQIVDLDATQLFRDGPNLLTAVRLMRERPMPWRGLVTGISHYRGGLLPEAFDHQLLNLSGDSQDLHYDFALAEQVLLNPAYTLDYVVIGLAVYSLDYDLALSADAWRCLKYFPALHDAHDADAKLPVAFDALFNPKIFAEESRDGASITQANFDSLFSTARIDYFSMPMAIRARVQGEKWSNRSYPATEALNSATLTRYIDLCRRAGTRVFLTLAPMSNLFRSAYPAARYAAFCQRLETEAARPGVHFRSFYGLTDNVAHFYDGDHLTTEGAQLFSMELRGWIEQTLATTGRSIL